MNFLIYAPLQSDYCNGDSLKVNEICVKWNAHAHDREDELRRQTYSFRAVKQKIMVTGPAEPEIKMSILWKMKILYEIA
jgi:hypothetical protein